MTSQSQACAGGTRTRVQCPSRRPRSRRALDASTNTRDNDMENDYYSIDAILAESQVNCFVSPTIRELSDIPSESPLCIQGRDPRPWVSRRRLREGCKCSMTLKRSSYVHQSTFAQIKTSSKLQLPFWLTPVLLLSYEARSLIFDRNKHN